MFSSMTGLSLSSCPKLRGSSAECKRLRRGFTYIVVKVASIYMSFKTNNFVFSYLKHISNLKKNLQNINRFILTGLRAYDVFFLNYCCQDFNKVELKKIQPSLPGFELIAALG